MVNYHLTSNHFKCVLISLYKLKFEKWYYSPAPPHIAKRKFFVRFFSSNYSKNVVFALTNVVNQGMLGFVINSYSFIPTPRQIPNDLFAIGGERKFVGGGVGDGHLNHFNFPASKTHKIDSVVGILLSPSMVYSIRVSWYFLGFSLTFSLLFYLMLYILSFYCFSFKVVSSLFRYICSGQFIIPLC